VLQVAALAVLFLGGGVVGDRLATWLAPDSFVARFFGLFVLPMAFASGLQSWVGFAIALALWRTVTRGPMTPEQRNVELAIPPGSIVFVPIAVGFAGVAGLLIGLLGSTFGILVTVSLYVLLGLGYGTACWLCARSGYLPFPQE
jgi:hypothetical protein